MEKKSVAQGIKLGVTTARLFVTLIATPCANVWAKAPAYYDADSQVSMDAATHTPSVLAPSDPSEGSTSHSRDESWSDRGANSGIDDASSDNDTD